MSAAFAYTSPGAIELDEIEAALLEAFVSTRDALTGGWPAVVVVREADVLGHGDPVAASMANALIGMVRSLAIEGVREGWHVSVLSIPDELPSEAVDEWIRRLADPAGMCGGLVRLGDLHLGRVPT